MAKTLRQDWFDWLDNTLVGDDSNPSTIDEEFRGGGGNDKIAGGVGDDWVRGGDDNDKLFGDKGDDVVDGDAGNDWLTGGEGTDTLNGGSGDDKLFFSGQDAYNGGSGTDTFDARTFGFIDVIASGTHNLTTIISDTQGVRIGLEEGVAEFRGTASAAAEDRYGDGDVLLGIGRGVASFSSIEQYDLTDFGDYFQGDDTADTINGFAGDDVIEGKGGADAINGGTGTDTVEYGSSGSVNVDLERGTGLMNDAEGDTYTSIENIRGSNLLDALYGNDNANKIMGRGGNDFLEGRGGADTLDGGTGIDEVMYASSTAGVNVDLTRATQLLGDAAGDRLINIENVSGSNLGDILKGDGGANKLSGLGGSDTIDGGHGNDILIGGDGAGIDTVSFESWDPTGLTFTPTINIALGLNGGVGHATETTSVYNGLTRQFVTSTESDDLYGFENVTGSNFGETITGNEGGNVIDGRGGNDTIDGGHGNDTLSGGEGIDTANFSSWDSTPGGGSSKISLGESGTIVTAGHAELQSFSISPTTGVVTSTIEVDQLNGFENVTGSNFSDVITGNSQDNTLNGRGGDDTINGAGGNDTIIGGSGFDNMTGGAGSDTFKFLAAGDMPVTDFAGGLAIVRLEQILDFQDGGGNEDVIDFASIRTATGGHLFLDDHDGQAFELGEIMQLTNGDGHSFISADTSGDGVVDLAISFDRFMTTLDNTDFLF